MTDMQHFSGKRLLLVEDDYFIARDTARLLTAEGAEVVGPASNVARALELIDAHQIDAAVLDVHLGSEMVFPVAEALSARGVPHVFATGYDQAAIPARHANVKRCEKPVEAAALAKALFG
jgi:CheY-like chemotaxis protein